MKVKYIFSNLRQVGSLEGSLPESKLIEHHSKHPKINAAVVGLVSIDFGWSVSGRPNKVFELITHDAQWKLR